MGEIIKNTGNEIKERWVSKMPRFFRQLVIVCACVMVTAFGVNEIMIIGHATPHDWWNDAYPLLLAVPFGMIVVCKLTVAGGYKELDPDKVMRGNLTLNADTDLQSGTLTPDSNPDAGMEPNEQELSGDNLNKL